MQIRADISEEALGGRMNIYIDTLGCFKNTEDSERAAGLLAEAGHGIVDAPEAADVLIVNTCGFVEDAKRESLARILELAEEKGARGAKLVVTGCLAQRYADDLFEELPEADAILGVNDYSELPAIVAGLVSEGGSAKVSGPSGERVLSVSGKEGILTGRRHRLTPTATAYIKVAEGCDNRCAYCAIPAIRGAYRSVPKEALLEEARRLAAEGAREAVLIAQDVSAYGQDLYGKPALPELLRDLCNVDGLDWIRLLYCYEERVTEGLIAAIAELEKICPYIDIPLQHVSDPVLRRMGRRSTEASIRGTIERLRAAVPGIAIRTTFMKGFPGETEQDFMRLLRFAEEYRFERLGVFAFSPEEGTRAADMPDQIPRETAEERRDALMRQQLDISLENNQRLVGRTLRVLVEEEEGTDGAGCEAFSGSVAGSGSFVYVGRTQYDAPEIDNAVLFSSGRPLQIGSFEDVRITDAMDYDIIGTL
jgi:ribosomal protein S12 methylthiotransferase